MLGGEDDVERFVTRAAIKLGSPLESYRGHYKLYVEQLSQTVSERLAADGLLGTLRIDFHQPPASGSVFIHRTHPLVVALADNLLERALESGTESSDDDAVARAGAAFVGNVILKTTVLLLRLRHQLTVTREAVSRLMLCEETIAVSITGQSAPEVLPPGVAQGLLGTEPVRNMPLPIKDRHIQQALDAMPLWQAQFEAIARDRAQSLLDDHRRVREAADARGTYQVSASLPVDVMGVYVLVPVSKTGTGV
jgi:hypothetical protein